MSSLTEVVAAVVERADGTFLMAQRPPGKVYAGYWEFPGGKVEPNEPAAAALQRELREELGLEVERAYPWISRTYLYPHAHVLLRFFRVRQWRGEPHPHEGQRLAWTSLGRIDLAPLLPANGPVLRALELPATLGITCASESGTAHALENLERALRSGLRMVMVREKAMTPIARLRFAREVVMRCHAAGALAVVNSDLDAARESGADGVHLTSAQLAATRERPPFDWCGASCHDRPELERATALGLDYAVLGPVRPTPSHAGTPTLGWTRLSQLMGTCSIPVFAIGGMRPHDLSTAWEAGAHGIAMMRGAWNA